MPHVYMPADHSDLDVFLAARVAEAVDSSELFVAWTNEAGTVFAPEASAPPAPAPAPLNPFAQALAEVVVAFGALFSLLFRPSRSEARELAPEQPRESRTPLEGAEQ